MYRILLHKPSMPKGTYQFLTKIVEETDNTVEPPVINKTVVPWETDDKAELEEQYIKLLDTYTKEQVRPVDDLVVELAVEITDETT